MPGVQPHDQLLYPENLTFGNYLFFLRAPTLIYQLTYPRSERWRIRYVLTCAMFPLAAMLGADGEDFRPCRLLRFRSPMFFVFVSCHDCFAAACFCAYDSHVLCALRPVSNCHKSVNATAEGPNDCVQEAFHPGLYHGAYVLPD